MKFFLFLALLPCIRAFNETHVDCPDQTSCPIGQTCCYNFDIEEYHCCDVMEHEKDNKKLIPAFPSHFKKDSDEVASNCSDNALLCPDGLCCKFESGVCCANSTSCCPNDYHCCSTTLNTTTTAKTWCCKTKQRCADTYLYCISGSNSISSTFLSLVMMLIITVSLKHF